MFLRRLSLAAFAIAPLILLGASCAYRGAVRTEPSLEPFYDMARLIMTGDEARVFKALPDERARAEFIREFWAIRDPKPETPENEAQVEFEKRVRYAALWFGSHNPYRGKDPGGPLKNLAGVSEERGRVYLLLGKPDVIIFFDGSTETTSFDGSRSPPRFGQWILEEWIYDNLHTYVVFKRSSDGGEWILDGFQSNFLDLLEWAKLNWLQGGEERGASTWFRFSAAYGPAGLQVAVPADRVTTDDRFQVELGIQVNIYRDNVKVDEIRDTRTIKQTQDNLFQDKDVRFVIPYTPGPKGGYLFDIIIQDLKASRPSKYRVLIKQSL